MENDFLRPRVPITKTDQSQDQESHFHGCPSLWLEFPGCGLQCQLKTNPCYSPVKSAHPVHSRPSLPPSLSAVWGREERAETPHWPRWLAANQLQPKVIGSRWETFWWREQGEQVASWKEEGKKKENERKARGEWKRDSGVYAVQTSWESHSWALIPWTECGGMSRKEP